MGCFVGYEAPKPSYNAPSYDAPSYEAPAPSYGAPSYDAPKPSYNAPSYEAPKPSYKAPKPSYGAPSSYDAPTGAPSYSAPKYDLLTPNRRDRYQTDFDEILTPESTRNSRDSGHHGHGSHHNSLHSGGHHHKTSGHRQGRKDDCYCVPVDQCPSFSVVGKLILLCDLAAAADQLLKPCRQSKIDFVFPR